jgi:peptidyl-prolyl cis-trans isomerase SurA
MSQECIALRAVAARAIVAATLALGSVLLVAATPTVASAQGEEIVAVVDGEPITAADVERRRKFDQLATHREPSRKEVIEELIAEKRKLREAQRSGIDVTDSDVENAYAHMAKRMNLTPEQLTAALAHAGIDPATLRHRIRADVAWMQYRRGRGVPSTRTTAPRRARRGTRRHSRRI